MNALISNPSKQEKITGTAPALPAFLLFAISDLCARLFGGTLPPYEVSFFGGVFGLLPIPFLWTKETTRHSPLPLRKKLRALWTLRVVSIFGTTACSVTAFYACSHNRNGCADISPAACYKRLNGPFLKKKVPFSS